MENCEEESILEEVLPEGWERREHAGRAVYVDHVNRITQWEPPPGTTTVRSWKERKSGKISSSHHNHQPTKSQSHPSLLTTTTTASPQEVSCQEQQTLNQNYQREKEEGNPPSSPSADSTTLGPPWAFFNYSLDDVRVRLYGDALADYVTMFRKHGDVHSSIYTGSPAMHSHVLGLVLAADARPYGASASVGRLQNLRVAVQRRWNNTVSDTARQQSMEIFLGMNIARHCPGLRLAAQYGALNDLPGLDPDDTLEEEMGLGAAHLGAELAALHLMKHDGKIGLQEDLRNLEPLPIGVGVGGSMGGESGSSGSSGADEEESPSQGLDPLGVLKSQGKKEASAYREESSSGNLGNRNGIETLGMTGAISPPRKQPPSLI